MKKTLSCVLFCSFINISLTKLFGCNFQSAFQTVTSVFEGVGPPVFSSNVIPVKDFKSEHDFKKILTIIEKNPNQPYDELYYPKSIVESYQSYATPRRFTWGSSANFHDFFNAFKPTIEISSDARIIINVFNQITRKNKGFRKYLAFVAAKEFTDTNVDLKARNFGPTHVAAMASNQRYQYILYEYESNGNSILARQFDSTYFDSTKTKMYNVQRSYCSFLSSTTKRQCLFKERCAKSQTSAGSPHWSLCFKADKPSTGTLIKVDAPNDYLVQSFNKRELLAALSANDNNPVRECMLNEFGYDQATAKEVIKSVFEIQNDHFKSDLENERKILIAEECQIKFQKQEP